MSEGVENRPSSIEGLGVFATRGFATGELIRTVVVEREITDDQPLRPGERDEHCARPDGKLLLLAAPDRHLNHSCDPNAWERHQPDGTIEIVARCAIGAGDEITVDYLVNNPGGASWLCSCGAARCRGRTGTSYFDLPAAFRQEYRPLLAPWFLRRYSDRVSDEP